MKLVRPTVMKDERGFFLESYRRDVLGRAGIDVAFVQDNHSRSVKNTVRGLHLQRASERGPGQAKLVRAATGAVFDVAVDLRPGSATFGKWHAEILSDENHHELFVPVGFAHGFCVISDVADVIYKVSSVYDGGTETGFSWDDPDVAVAWPTTAASALLSARDQKAPSLRILKETLGL